MYSKYTEHISSNGNHFLMARFLLYSTYKVSKFGYGQTKQMVTMYSMYTALGAILKEYLVSLVLPLTA